jgi:hypothetical protein
MATPAVYDRYRHAIHKRGRLAWLGLVAVAVAGGLAILIGLGVSAAARGARVPIVNG